MGTSETSSPSVATKNVASNSQKIETNGSIPDGKMVVKKELEYHIRKMRVYEIPQVLELCKREGRQMGLDHELVSWFRFDPDGFYVSVHPNSGKIL